MTNDKPDRPREEFWIRPPHNNLPFGACVEKPVLGGIHVIEYSAYEKLQAKLKMIQDKVNAQADDEGLWFNAKYVTESYLQIALRQLHKVIEEKIK